MQSSSFMPYPTRRYELQRTLSFQHFVNFHIYNQNNVQSWESFCELEKFSLIICAKNVAKALIPSNVRTLIRKRSGQSANFVHLHQPISFAIQTFGKFNYRGFVYLSYCVQSYVYLNCEQIFNLVQSTEVHSIYLFFVLLTKLYY